MFPRILAIYPIVQNVSSDIFLLERLFPVISYISNANNGPSERIFLRPKRTLHGCHRSGAQARLPSYRLSVS